MLESVPEEPGLGTSQPPGGGPNGKSSTGVSLKGASTGGASMGKNSSLKDKLSTAELNKDQAHWNEIFKNKEKLRDPEVLEDFWYDVKKRLSTRFGSIQDAFKHIDSSGDGSINFLEFCDFLRTVNLPLDQRVARNVFDKAAGRDRFLSMEELKSLLLARTMRKLTSVMQERMQSTQRVQSHVQAFISHLVLTNETFVIRAVDRFQDKLQLDFCRELWQDVMKQVGDDGLVTRDGFEEMLQKYVGRKFGLLAYEVTLMLRVFDRVDRRNRGCVGMNELISTLAMLSTERDKILKAAFIFDLFDSDYDGCLLYEQIMPMFLCICSMRPVVDVSLRAANDLDFQEELSVQEGQRAYELALWHFQRTGRVEGGIVTRQELVHALERLPYLLDCLMPGAVQMRWAVVDLEKEFSQQALAEERERPSPSTAVSSSSPTSLAATAPAKCSLSHSGAPQLNTRYLSASLPEPPGSSQPSPAASLSMSPSPVGAGASGRKAHTTLSQSSLPSSSRRSPNAVSFTDPAPWDAAKFQQNRFNGFRSTLRGWGGRRLAEMTAGYMVQPEVEDTSMKEVSTSSSSSGIGHSRNALGGGSPGGKIGGLGARSSSAPQLADAGRAVASGGSPMRSRRTPDAGSQSGALRKGGGLGGGTTEQRGGANQRMAIDSNVSVYLSNGGKLAQLGYLTPEVAPLPLDKWGGESVQRYRIFAAARVAEDTFT